MSKTTTAKQAIAQILKMNDTKAKLEDKRKPERGADWYKNTMYNKTLDAKIAALDEKTIYYSHFITEQDYDASELPGMMCCTYEEFIG